MDYRRALLAGFLLSTVAAATIPACILACDSIGCVGGFELELVAGEGLTPGEYALALGLEDETHALTCTVDADGSGTCGDGDVVSGFGVTADVYRDDDGLAQISLRIQDGRETDGEFQAHRGPEQVAVEVTLAGEVVGAASYTPEYERRDYRGDPECGYCDTTDAQTLALDLD